MFSNFYEGVKSIESELGIIFVQVNDTIYLIDCMVMKSNIKP